MNLKQLAEAHDITDVKGLNDALLRARDTYFEAWFEDTQVGPDSLDMVGDHLEAAWWELVENP